MKKEIVSLGIFVFVLGLFLTLPATSQAQVELKEGMTQGDFALWLVKAIGAQSLDFLTPGEVQQKQAPVNFLLNPAAGSEEAIEFLTQLGSIPEGGWKKDEEMTKAALADLLGDKDAANLSWDDLVKKVRDYIQSIFDERKLGTFRVLAPTPSVPAV